LELIYFLFLNKVSIDLRSYVWPYKIE